MGEIIHCRKDDDGEYRFRVWSTIVTSYLTAELREGDVHRYLRQRGMESSLSTVACERQVERAKSVGTSDYYTTKPSHPLKQPWNKEQIEHIEGVTPDAIDLSDMFFLVAAEAHIFEGPHLVERMKENSTGTFSMTIAERFETWAELSCFGEVFSEEGHRIVRVLPPEHDSGETAK
jgi:hypothetical protein